MPDDLEMQIEGAGSQDKAQSEFEEGQEEIDESKEECELEVVNE